MSFLVDILRPTVEEGSSWYHFLKKASGGCSDLMYSGHMLVAVLTAMAWTVSYGYFVFQIVTSHDQDAFIYSPYALLKSKRN